MFEAYSIIWIGVIAAQITPGPNFLAVASAALGQGRRAALYTVFGVVTGTLLWATGTAFGLAALIAAFPAMLTTMKIFGGVYLLWMAIKAIRAAIAGGQMSIKAQQAASSPFLSWRRGLFVVLSNPKAALMWIAVGTFLFARDLIALQVVVFAPLAAFSAALIYGSHAFLFSSGLAATSYQRYSRWFEFGFGGAFGALGSKLLYDGFREIRL